MNKKRANSVIHLVKVVKINGYFNMEKQDDIQVHSMAKLISSTNALIKMGKTSRNYV